MPANFTKLPGLLRGPWTGRSAEVRLIALYSLTAMSPSGRALGATGFIAQQAPLKDQPYHACFFRKQGDIPRKTGSRLSTNRAIAERDQGLT